MCFVAFICPHATSDASFLLVPILDAVRQGGTFCIHTTNTFLLLMLFFGQANYNQ